MLLKSSSSTELETGVVSLPSRQRVGLLRFAGPDGLEIDVLEALTRENAVFDCSSNACLIVVPQIFDAKRSCSQDAR